MKYMLTAFIACLLSQYSLAQRLQSKALNEVSGIAMAVGGNAWYMHNDSGDTSRFFIINKDGSLRATCYFKGNVHDCEDLAADRDYVYIGDIGDNPGIRPSITIYRCRAPKANARGSINVSSKACKLRYPDGPRDAETMMIDPKEKLLYIVSKREDSVSIYTLPLRALEKDSAVMEKRCRILLPGFRQSKWIVGGDISSDGSKILLKSYRNVFYWKRAAGEPAWQAMRRRPSILPYKVEPQGEAICFDAAGKGYYTVSEGFFPEIYYYRLGAY